MRSVKISKEFVVTVLTLLAGGAISALPASATDGSPTPQPIVVEKTVISPTTSGGPGNDSPINGSTATDQSGQGCVANNAATNQTNPLHSGFKSNPSIGGNPAGIAWCPTDNSQINNTLDNYSALTAEQKTAVQTWAATSSTAKSGDVSARLANLGITGPSSADVKISDIGKAINGGQTTVLAPSTSVVNRDDNRVFAPNLSQVSGPVIPGQDRYIIKDDCDKIQADLTVSPVLKARRASFALFGIGLSADLSNQKFENLQEGIQGQVMSMLHAAVMRSAERGSSYSFTRSAIAMSLESAKRSGLSVDVSATMADLDAQFTGKPQAWKEARNEAISNRNSLCTNNPPSNTPPPSVVVKPELTKLCLATSGRGGKTVYSTIFVASTLGLRIGDRYQNGLVVRIEDCNVQF